MLSPRPSNIESSLSIWLASVLRAGRPLLVMVVIVFLPWFDSLIPGVARRDALFSLCAHAGRLQQRLVSPGLPRTHGARPGADGPARTMRLLQRRKALGVVKGFRRRRASPVPGTAGPGRSRPGRRRRRPAARRRSWPARPPGRRPALSARESGRRGAATSRPPAAPPPGRGAAASARRFLHWTGPERWVHSFPSAPARSPGFPSGVTRRPHRPPTPKG